MADLRHCVGLSASAGRRTSVALDRAGGASRRSHCCLSDADSFLDYGAGRDGASSTTNARAIGYRFRYRQCAE